MSLYNQLFEENPDANVLLGMLGVNKEIFERYRDIYLNKDGTKITVYTRCGGGNRMVYGRVFEIMKNHPNYLRDYDDSFDNTYAYIEFSVPDKFKFTASKIKPKEEPLKVHEKFKDHAKKAELNPNGPEALKDKIIAAQILGAIEADKDNKNPGIRFIEL